MQLHVAVALRLCACARFSHRRRAGATQQARVRRHGRARRATEQLVQRALSHLAGNVPECDVDAGQREHHRTVPAEDVDLVRHLAHQRRDVGGITPDEQRRNEGVERHLGSGRDRMAERLAPAFHAGVGAHSHQQHVDASRRTACDEMIAAGGRIGHGQQERVNFSNQHGMTRATAIATAAVAWTGEYAQ